VRLIKQAFDSRHLKKDIYEIHVSNKQTFKKCLSLSKIHSKVCFLKSTDKKVFPSARVMELIEFSGRLANTPKVDYRVSREDCKIREIPLASCRWLLHKFFFRQPATRFRLIRGVRNQDLLIHKYQILKSLKRKYPCRVVMAFKKNGKPLAFNFVYCKKKTLWLYELMSGRGLISRIAGLESVLENLKYFAGKISCVKTNVYGHNLPAIAMFKKLGLSPGRRSFYMLLQK